MRLSCQLFLQFMEPIKEGVRLLDAAAQYDMGKKVLVATLDLFWQLGFEAR